MEKANHGGDRGFSRTTCSHVKTGPPRQCLRLHGARRALRLNAQAMARLRRGVLFGKYITRNRLRFFFAKQPKRTPMLSLAATPRIRTHAETSEIPHESRNQNLVLKFGRNPRAMSRMNKAAAPIYGWDYPLLTFIYPGFDCGSCGSNLGPTPPHVTRICLSTLNKKIAH